MTPYSEPDPPNDYGCSTMIVLAVAVAALLWLSHTFVGHHGGLGL